MKIRHVAWNFNVCTLLLRLSSFLWLTKLAILDSRKETDEILNDEQLVADIEASLASSERFTIEQIKTDLESAGD